MKTTNPTPNPNDNAAQIGAMLQAAYAAGITKGYLCGLGFGEDEIEVRTDGTIDFQVILYIARKPLMAAVQGIVPSLKKILPPDTKVTMIGGSPPPPTVGVVP